MRSVHLVCLGIVATFGWIGCKDSSSTNQYQPAQQWNSPNVAPSGAGPGNPHANTPHPGHPHGTQHPSGGDVTALGLPPPDPNRAIDSSKFLRGTLVGTKETTPLIKLGAVVFISVKRLNPETGQGMGPPLAVEKLKLTQLPMPFQLSEAQAMISGTQFEGDVVITAWTDQDQDAMTKQSGDIIGQVRSKIPSDGIKLTLDTKKP